MRCQAIIGPIRRARLDCEKPLAGQQTPRAYDLQSIVTKCGIAFGVASLALLFSAHPCRAQQVTGTFFPTAFGDIQEGATPFNETVKSDVPYYVGKALQLQNELDLQRRPYITQHSAYANQSLIPKVGQLDTLTEGVEAGFYPNLQTKVSFHYLPTIFGTAGLHQPRVFGQEFRMTVRQQPTDRFNYYIQTGLFQTVQRPHVNGGLAVIGGIGATYALHDRVRFSAGYRRDIIGNTILSAVGYDLPNGQLVGRDKQNLFYVSTDLRPIRKTNISFLYGTGFVDGHKVPTNRFQEWSYYMGRPVLSRPPQSHLSMVLPSYQFLVLNYAHDNSNLGNAIFTPLTAAQQASALRGEAQVGPTSPNQKRSGVGGYFSPQLFILNNIRLDLAGHIAGPVYYTLGGGLGYAGAKTTFSKLNHQVFGAAANVGINYRVSKNIHVEHGWFFLQSDTVYRRQVFYTQTKYYL